jgi:hypothetical protein
VIGCDGRGTKTSTSNRCGSAVPGVIVLRCHNASVAARIGHKDQWDAALSVRSVTNAKGRCDSFVSITGGASRQFGAPKTGIVIRNSRQTLRRG